MQQHSILSLVQARMLRLQLALFGVLLVLLLLLIQVALLSVNIRMQWQWAEFEGKPVLTIAVDGFDILCDQQISVKNLMQDFRTFILFFEEAGHLLDALSDFSDRREFTRMQIKPILE